MAQWRTFRGGTLWAHLRAHLWRSGALLAQWRTFSAVAHFCHSGAPLAQWRTFGATG